MTEDTAATTAYGSVPGQRDPAAARGRSRPRDGLHARRRRLPVRAAHGHRGPGRPARLHPRRDRGPADRRRRGLRDAAAQAVPGTDLDCAFELGAEAADDHRLGAAAEPRQLPARDTFAWTVLAALAGEVDTRLDADDQVSIVLREARGSVSSGTATAPRHHGTRSGVSSELEVQVTEDSRSRRGRPRRPRAIEHSLARPGARPRAVRASWPTLPEDDPERPRIRDELVELHLPLVEYLARRFRNRGEPLDDLSRSPPSG